MATATGTRLSTDVQPRAGQCTVWDIDPKHTLVEFGVKHMMFTTVKGRFTGVRGTINCADEADASRASVEAEIDAASVNTGEEQRDVHLRSAEFLDAERYPTMTFKSTRVERQDAERLRVLGDLTIRGVTHEVVLETTFNGMGKNPRGQEVAGFTAETTINRKDFGLTWNAALESGGLLVGDKLEILIEVQAVRTS
jgi:polyisoprenoid-binding protein YceI